MLQLQAQALEQQERVYKNQIRLNVREILQGELNFYNQVRAHREVGSDPTVTALSNSTPRVVSFGAGASQHQLHSFGPGWLQYDDDAAHPAS